MTEETKKLMKEYSDEIYHNTRKMSRSEEIAEGAMRTYTSGFQDGHAQALESLKAPIESALDGETIRLRNKAAKIYSMNIDDSMSTEDHCEMAFKEAYDLGYDRCFNQTKSREALLLKEVAELKNEMLALKLILSRRVKNDR